MEMQQIIKATITTINMKSHHMTSKTQNVREGSRSFRMRLNLNDYGFKQVDIVIGQHI